MDLMMKPIEKFTDRLNQVMAENNWRQVDLLEKVKPKAEKAEVKISKSHISNYATGKNIPESDKIFILADTLGVTEAWLLGYDVPRYKEDHSASEDDLLTVYRQLEESYKMKVIDFTSKQLKEQNKIIQFKDYVDEKLYGYVSAGGGEYLGEETIEPILIPKDEVPSQPYDLVLRVSGDSMKPTFEHGENIFVKRTEEVRNGQFAVFIINGESYLKKVYVERERLILVSLNDKYEDLIFNYNDNIKLIGTVVL